MKSGATLATDLSPAARLRLVLVRLVRATRQSDSAGLSPSQVSALATLEENGPMRISALAEKEHLLAPVATRIVASLYDAGYLSRASDPQDRRATVVGLSRAGKGALARVWNERTVGLSARIEHLTAGERERLLDALDVLEKLAHDADASTDR